jgi:AcrR family transcriptional regulator
MTSPLRRTSRSGSPADPDRRQALIAAAFRAIATAGFEGLRVRAVAAAAGIDHSTLHHYFPTKRALVAAVADYATEQFRPPARSPSAALTSLEDHLAFLGRMIQEHADLHVVLRELDLRATRDRDVRAIVIERENGWRSALATRLRTASAEGHWGADFDVSAGVELIIAAVKGASLNRLRGPEVLAMLRYLFARQAARRPRRQTGERS